MTAYDRLRHDWQLWLGTGLFAGSLIWLAMIASPLIAIACALGGGAALLLFAITRSGFALAVLTLLMLAISGCALLAALLAHDLTLLPVGAAQILGILLLEKRDGPSWMEVALAARGSRARPVRS